MTNEVEAFPVLRISKEGDGSSIEETVAKEYALTIILNDQELVTLLCSPLELKYLAVGFLFSEGLVNSRDEITRITVDDRSGVARVDTKGESQAAGELIFKRLITTGCGRGASFFSAADAHTLAKVDSDGRMPASDVFGLVSEFQHGSRLYQATHGVHSAALCDGRRIEAFSEDVGRHNAIDRIFGKCLMEGLPTEGRTVITSGRVSSEILLKVAKRNIPIIVSIAAPTDVAVELADNLGVTLIGSVRGGKMIVFSHDWRVVRDNGQLASPQDGDNG